jgi:archaellum component FlaC
MYIAGKDRQSFISDLQVYGSLKSGIQELSKQADKLKNEVTSLETQRQYLSRYIQVTDQTWNISRRNILQEVEVAINTLEYDMGDMNPIQEKS